MFTKQTIIESGLVEAGLNEDGQMEYIGTDKQWKEAERIQLINDTYDLEKQMERDFSYANQTN